MHPKKAHQDPPASPGRRRPGRRGVPLLDGFRLTTIAPESPALSICIKRCYGARGVGFAGPLAANVAEARRLAAARLRTAHLFNAMAASTMTDLAFAVAALGNDDAYVESDLARRAPTSTPSPLPIITGRTA